MTASPYGFWTSPITSDLVVADAIRLEQVALDGDAVTWSETQPQKQGRTFVCRLGANGEPERLTPDDANAFSVRSRAHEYGGGAFAVADGVVYFSNNRDQRLYRQDPGQAPRPITPAPADAAADALRYADGVVDRRRGRMICVREDHTLGGEAINTLVGVDLAGAGAQKFWFRGTISMRRRASAPTAPAFRGSPGAIRTCRGSRQRPGSARSLRTEQSAMRAGSPAARTSWCSSRNGRPTGTSLSFPTGARAGGTSIPSATARSNLCGMDAEFGRPQWQFGMSTYAFESADRLIACFVRDGVWTLAAIDTRSAAPRRHPDRVH